MGTGSREKETKYVPPQVAEGMSIACPSTFTAVPVEARSSIPAGSEYPIGISGGGSIVIGASDIMAVVSEAPDALNAALLAGCRYVARFAQRAAEGQLVSVEVFLE